MGLIAEVAGTGKYSQDVLMQAARELGMV